MKKGFTLIELAIVLVIIGLLIGVGVSLLPGIISQQKYTQNQSLINQNYNALIGYIMANGKAPLASSDTNNTAQSQNIGYLPYVSIGGLKDDAYGNTFYYAVNNRSLNISINGSSATNMSLTNSNSISTFCAVLYALNYYYNNQNPALSASDVRTIVSPNQTTYTPDVFVLISSGANGKLDSPNTITNSSGVFASKQYPLSQNYDDIVEALSITNAIGQFCSNNPATQFSVTYANGVYYLNSVSSNSNNTNSGSQNPPNDAHGKCVSNCNKDWWCLLKAMLYGGCSQACKQNPNFCP